MKIPANTCKCQEPALPDLTSYIAPAMGLPISIPSPTQAQYIPDLVPSTVKEGQKSGIKAPGSATRTPDIIPQKTDQAMHGAQNKRNRNGFRRPDDRSKNTGQKSPDDGRSIKYGQEIQAKVGTDGWDPDFRQQWQVEQRDVVGSGAEE
ncbi:hypothetical protein VP1G_11241 [Cytospora mali]|uniref:Uncharacterized protein n=1 Tax=Cytospora mali TaxID=578113 RepID=A0A194VAL0_CYTMA|nr:hypothetical protein VP1G_11241 [Valsa mali var. pyri (nom. inval.)]